MNSRITTDVIINDLNDYSWPIMVGGPNPINIIFGNDLICTDSSQYFNILSDNVTIDGDGYVLAIDNVVNFPGLVICNPGTLSGIVIQNITMSCGSSILSSYNGWIAQGFFSSNINSQIINCSSDGPIIDAGGICGQYCSCIISNCTTSGEISGYVAGGICCQNCICTINDCSTSGTITNQSSGICGQQSTYTLNNCSSSGSIISGAGISFNAVEGILNNCSSSGNINSGSCGIGNSFVNCVLNNCHSSGTLESNCSGILLMSSNCTLNNCWTSGNILGSFSSGINVNNQGVNTLNYCYFIGKIIAEQCAGISNSVDDINVILNYCYATQNPAFNSCSISIGLATLNYCYCLYFPTTDLKATITTSYNANGFWSDSEAITAFGGSIPAEYTSIGHNTPYLLTSFNKSQYASSSSIVNRDTPFTISATAVNQTNYKLYINVPELSTLQVENDGTIIDTGENIPGVYILNIVSSETGTLSNTENTYRNYNIAPYELTVDASCFEENTIILTPSGYVKIKDLKIGDLVEIYTSDPNNKYKKIIHLFKSAIKNNLSNERTKDSMYIMDDLELTGGHSVLVDKLTSKEEELMSKYWPIMQKINDKYLLLTFANNNFIKKIDNKIYNVYQLVLESDNNKEAYGVYAGNNNILCETMCLEYYNSAK